MCDNEACVLAPSEGNLLARAVSLGDLCPYAAWLKYAASCNGHCHQAWSMSLGLYRPPSLPDP